MTRLRGTIASSIGVALVCGLSVGAQNGAGWRRSRENPVIVPGVLDWTTRGSISIAASDPFVLFDEETGMYRMWFGTGGPGDQGDFVWIQYAESKDGDHWKVQREAALEPGASKNSWDYTNSETPSIIVDSDAPPDRRYVLFYSGGNKLQKEINGFPVYSIGVAYSADGRRFRRMPASESRQRQEGLALTSRDLFPKIRFSEGIVSDPVAVRRDGVTHLWFSALTIGSGPQINGVGYASTTDDRTWKAHNKQVIDELGIPFVLANPRTGKFELWGNLDEPEREKVLPEKGVIDLGAATLRFRHYTSDDGVNWTREERKDLAYDAGQRAEVCGLTPGPAVVLRGEGNDQRYEIYYGAWGKNRVPAGSSFPCVWAINRAVLERE